MRDAFAKHTASKSNETAVLISYEHQIWRFRSARDVRRHSVYANADAFPIENYVICKSFTAVNKKWA